MHDIGTLRCSVRCAHVGLSARLFPCAWRTLLKAGTVEQVYESCGVRFSISPVVTDSETLPLPVQGCQISPLFHSLPPLPAPAASPSPYSVLLHHCRTERPLPLLARKLLPAQPWPLSP